MVTVWDTVMDTVGPSRRAQPQDLYLVYGLCAPLEGRADLRTLHSVLRGCLTVALTTDE